MEVLWVLRERKGKDGSVFIFDTRVWQARERVELGWAGVVVGTPVLTVRRLMNIRGQKGSAAEGGNGWW